VIPKEKFNLGFEKYLERLPDQGAAKPLGRELKSVAWVINQIMEVKGAEIGEVKRNPLDVEMPEKVDKKDKKEEKEAKGKAAKKLTDRDQFEVTFTAEQRYVSQVLNEIVACKEQFYVPRRIKIENAQVEGPSKVDPSKNDSSKPEAAARLNYILGEEKITATVHLEAVYFEKPEAAAPKKGNAPKAN
jgi:hypothetical protein